MLLSLWKQALFLIFYAHCFNNTCAAPSNQTKRICGVYCVGRELLTDIKINSVVITSPEALFTYDYRTRAAGHSDNLITDYPLVSVASKAHKRSTDIWRLPPFRNGQYLLVSKRKFLSDLGSYNDARKWGHWLYTNGYKTPSLTNKTPRDWRV